MPKMIKQSMSGANFIGRNLAKNIVTNVIFEIIKP